MAAVTVPTPVLDDLAASRSLYDGLTRLLRQGRLGQAAKELGLVAAAAREAGSRGEGPLAKARRYEAIAARVPDRETREGYLQLARNERAKAVGAL